MAENRKNHITPQEAEKWRQTLRKIWETAEKTDPQEDPFTLLLGLESLNALVSLDLLDLLHLLRKKEEKTKKTTTKRRKKE